MDLTVAAVQEILMETFSLDILRFGSRDVYHIERL